MQHRLHNNLDTLCFVAISYYCAADSTPEFDRFQGVVQAMHFQWPAWLSSKCFSGGDAKATASSSRLRFQSREDAGQESRVRWGTVV